MATGTGKTYTAFQIIWRLWKAGRKKRILFLADRNVLIDQTMVNDFRPFGAAMAKLSTSAKTIERDDGTSDRPDPRARQEAPRSTPRTRSISASIRRSPDPRNARSCSASSRPDFFDLIVIDECHRGSAAEDSGLARNPRILLRAPPRSA